MSATQTRPQKSCVYSGVLSEIMVLHLGDGHPVVSAILTRTVRGESVRVPIAAAGPALESVQDQMVEDGEVAFYGRMGDTTFVVLGPDLRRRTLVRNGIPVPPRAPRSVRSVEERRAARRSYFAARHRRNKA